MNLSLNNEYNPVQLNETVNLSPDGKVLSKSLMINIRGESVKEVWKNYKELKKLIDGNGSKKENGNKKETKESEKKTEVCPQCGGILVEKQGISRNGVAYHFWGCSNFPACGFTKRSQEKSLPPVADEDLVSVVK